MTFRTVFIAVVIAAALIVAAFMINLFRPNVEVEQPGPDFVRATGKCATCHAEETSAVVHEYEMSAHAKKGVNCLDCHRPAPGQKKMEHRGFVITETMTAANCRQCHQTQYEQFLRSRHAAPAWAAVSGPGDFTPEQVQAAEALHPGAVQRPPNALALLEGDEAIQRGCQQCHSVGKPNADGSIGTCTACHARHSASVRLARLPETCGQCHMGPDHSQIEIYHESKHGVLFNAQRDQMNLEADPKRLTTRDMPVPTCATCHMSGLEGLKFTHDTSERLSYYLFAAVSDKRPNYQLGQIQMKEVCLKCHTKKHIDQYYEEAEKVVARTNDYVRKSQAIMEGLRKDGLLTPAPYDQPIEFLAFNLWHYDGRTAKHGAFMGGADFVQWHGFFELVQKLNEMQAMADEMRRAKRQGE